MDVLNGTVYFSAPYSTGEAVYVIQTSEAEGLPELVIEWASTRNYPPNSLGLKKGLVATIAEAFGFSTQSSIECIGGKLLGDFISFLASRTRIEYLSVFAYDLNLIDPVYLPITVNVANAGLEIGTVMTGPLRFEEYSELISVESNWKRADKLRDLKSYRSDMFEAKEASDRAHLEDYKGRESGSKRLEFIEEDE